MKAYYMSRISSTLQKVILVNNMPMRYKDIRIKGKRHHNQQIFQNIYFPSLNMRIEMSHME